MKSKTKVLIVDDNKDLLPVFGCINDDKIEYVTAPDGIKALKMIENDDRIHAVLVDLSMASFDGIATVEEIRRNEELHLSRPKLRLAFYTAATVDIVIERVQKQNDVERIFSKPFSPFELTAEIKQWLSL